MIVLCLGSIIYTHMSSSCFETCLKTQIIQEYPISVCFVLFSAGPGIYYFRIIDALQSYTWKNRLETWVRKYIQRLDGKGISCVDPVNYRNRFMRYMRNIMISDVSYKKKTRLVHKKFTTERVSIYPSSQNIEDDLNNLKREKEKAKTSYTVSMSASRVINRKSLIRKRNNGKSGDGKGVKNLNMNLNASYSPKSYSISGGKRTLGIDSDITALSTYKSGYHPTVRTDSMINFKLDD